MRAKIVSTEKWILTHSSVGKVPIAITESPRWKIREEITAINPNRHMESMQSQHRKKGLSPCAIRKSSQETLVHFMEFYSFILWLSWPSILQQHVQDDSEKVGEG